MKTASISINLILIIGIAFLSVSCSASAGQTQIEEVGLYLDPEGAQPTTSYSFTNPFYCIVKLTGAQENSEVQASWIALDAHNLAPETILKIEKKTPQGDQLLFKLTNEGNFWPVGDYQLNIYLNGKLAQELAFEVYWDDFE